MPNLSPKWRGHKINIYKVKNDWHAIARSRSARSWEYTNYVKYWHERNMVNLTKDIITDL